MHREQRSAIHHPPFSSSSIHRFYEIKMSVNSVTRLGDFLHFEQPFKAGGNNYFTKLPTLLSNFCKGFYWNDFWATFIDIWQFLSGHTGRDPHLDKFNSKSWSFEREFYSVTFWAFCFLNGPFPASFSSFSSFQYICQLLKVLHKILPMTGFQPRTSCVGSECSATQSQPRLRILSIYFLPIFILLLDHRHHYPRLLLYLSVQLHCSLTLCVVFALNGRILCRWRDKRRVIRSMTNCSLERKRVQMSRMKHLPKVHDRKYHKFRKMGQSRPLFVYFRPFLITISIMQIEKV